MENDKSLSTLDINRVSYIQQNKENTITSTKICDQNTQTLSLVTRLISQGLKHYIYANYNIKLRSGVVFFLRMQEQHMVILITVSLPT